MTDMKIIIKGQSSALEPVLSLLLLNINYSLVSKKYNLKKIEMTFIFKYVKSEINEIMKIAESYNRGQNGRYTDSLIFKE